MELFSLGVKAVWVVASQEAKAANSAQIEPEHFLAALTKLPTIVARQLAGGTPREAEVLSALQAEVSPIHQLLQEANVNPKRLRRRLRELFPSSDTDVQSARQLRRSERSHVAFRRAAEIAVGQRAAQLSCAHLFLGILEELLAAQGPEDTLRGVLEAEVGDIEQFVQIARQQLLGRQSNAVSRVPFSVTLVGERDLTAEAHQGHWGKLVGRQEHLARLIAILSGGNRAHVLLLGESGVGKSALVHELACRISLRQVPESLALARVVMLDLEELAAAFSSSEARVQGFQQWITQIQGDGRTLVVLQGLGALVACEECSRGFPLASLLISSLRRKDFPCLAMARPEEFCSLREQLPDLLWQFTLIVIPELSVRETCKVLARERRKYQSEYRVEIPPGMLRRLVDFSVWFMPDRYLPGKALWLLEETCKWLSQTRKRELGEEHALEAEGSPPTAITEAIVAKVLSRELGEDASRILRLARGPTHRRIRELNKEWARRAGVTRKAVRALRRRLLLAASGLAPSTRPLAVFLLRGRGGLFARKFARLLAKGFRGPKGSWVHLDLSSLATTEDRPSFFANRMQGLTLDSGIKLVDQLRQHPFAVFLLDNVHNSSDTTRSYLRNLFERGFLIDSLGRLGDARRAIFLLNCDISITSSSVSPRFGVPLGISGEASLRDLEVPALPIEFLSAIDDVLELRPISLRRVTEIVRREVDRLKRKIHARYGLPLNVTESVVRLLAKVTFRKAGIAALRRVLERELLEPLSNFLMRGDSAEWASLEVRVKAGRIRVRPGRIVVPKAPALPSCCECHRPVPEDCKEAWAWIGNLFLCPECKGRVENLAQELSGMSGENTSRNSSQ
jgi:ATP-dependent Clp protease ATP-binding subunit ClpC